MEAVIKEVYESNFGTAYETYKEAVKKDQYDITIVLTLVSIIS